MTKRLLLLVFVCLLGAIPSHAQQIIPIVVNSATINLDSTSGNSFKIFVTTTFTLHITGQPTAQSSVITILFAQDGTGHAVTFDTNNFKNTMAVPTTASSNTPQSFQYDGNTNFWYGIAGGGSGGSGVTSASGTYPITVTSPTTTPVVACAGCSVLPVGVDSGAANAYVFTTNPAVTLTFGQSFYGQVANANSGSSTANVDGSGVKDIRAAFNSANLLGGEMTTGVIYQFTYDGTQWLLAGTVGGSKANPGGKLNLAGAYLIPTPTTDNEVSSAGLSFLTTPANSAVDDRQLLNFICTPTGGGGCGGTTNTWGSFGLDHDGFVLYSGTMQFGFETTVSHFENTIMEDLGTGDNLRIFQGNTPADGARALRIDAPLSTTEIAAWDPNNGKEFSAGNHCVSSATPAVCGTSWTGLVAIPAGGATLTVNTSAVAAGSKIFLQSDDTVGATLGVTCNTTTATLVGGLAVTARTAGTSFEITSGTTPSTNPECVSFHIED